jgi:Outer membrane protein beta-barrel domain
MKKIVFALIAFAAVTTVSAQNKKNISKADLTSTAGDHFMLQLTSDHWAGTPDSIKSHSKGLSRGLSVYVMMNKPFKNNPHFSAAFGVGVGTSHMYFKNYTIDVKSTAAKLPFTSLDSADHFKKFKLATAYLEIPVELRFVSDPLKSNKSMKFAIGVKVGTLLNVHTKGKTLQNRAGSTINTYAEKETNKRFFNSTRVAATARIGYGNFSLFGSYQFTNLLKDGFGPDIKPFQIGLCISGL